MAVLRITKRKKRRKKEEEEEEARKLKIIKVQMTNRKMLKDRRTMIRAYHRDNSLPDSPLLIITEEEGSVQSVETVRAIRRRTHRDSDR